MLCYYCLRAVNVDVHPLESRQQLNKAKLDEVLVAHCKADLVTECMKKKKKHLILSVTFVFVFQPKMNVHFRFRFVFGRKWNFIFFRYFRLRPKMKNAFRSASSIHHKKVLNISKAWSWSTS